MTGEGDPAPQQARRRRAPVDATGMWREYTRSSSGERAAHVIPQTHNQAATQKSKTRRERLAQGLSKDPVQHGLVDLFTSSRAPPPRREADAVYPPQHEQSALKNMSVERRKARPAVRGPFNKADAASRTLSKARTHQAPTSVSKPSTTTNGDRPDH